jgi:plasmid stabilization system protein ParE
MTVVFDPLAAREYEEAFDYYEAQEPGLGDAFRSAVWEVLTIVERYAEIGEEVRPGIRRILVRRFPYKVIYAPLEETLYVLAVAHGHREPDYWIDRS